MNIRRLEKDLSGWPDGELKRKLLHWSHSFSHFALYCSNGYTDRYSDKELLAGAGASVVFSADDTPALPALQDFLDKHPGQKKFGFLSYELKNEIEDLESRNPDHSQFPLAVFFVPQHVLELKEQKLVIHSDDPEKLWEELVALKPSDEALPPVKVQARISRDSYLRDVQSLQDHIHRGDIYEINYCQEFFAEAVQTDPAMLFERLNALSPAPFAGYFKANNHHILSASPERFLLKRKDLLISQPIKGTRKRLANPEADKAQARALAADEKEQAENVMIVDLVRNDLTRCCLPATVRVEELFGIYSFSHVHQMISTISGKVAPDKAFTEIIRSTFPMGSMTGAPKIRAMQLADQYEHAARGAYSGTMGYLDESGDFDLNVIIRSIIYQASTGYLSFQTGGAITAASEPEKEYEESLLKGAAIRQVLEQKNQP